MTDAQALSQRYDIDEHFMFRQSCSLSQPCLSCIDQISAALPHFSNGHQDLTMAQSMLADHYRPDGHMQYQPWPLQPASADDVKPSGTGLVSSSPGMAYSSDCSWSGAAGVSTSFDCHQVIRQVEPYILRQSDSQFGQNSDLMYNHFAVQNDIPKGCGYAVPATRALAHSNGLPQGANTILSTTAMRTSISPKSFTSDEFDNSYSPESMPDQASPSCNWGTIPMYSPNTVVPSLKPETYYADAGLSGMPQMEGSLGLSLAPSTGHTGREQTIQIPRKGPVSAPEHSYSHDSNQGASPWLNPKYFSSADHMWGTQSQSHLGTESHAAPTQDRIQPRYQVPRRVSTQCQRERNDRVLIEGKKRGETYKEIKKKLIGENPAESTLRGRYRSLTKDRRDRVRKPVWTKFDTELLDETVQQELKRIESNMQNPSALSIEQKLMKVSWKKVADYIEENGGSYHFGNSTCKRKWLELNSACE